MKIAKIQYRRRYENVDENDIKPFYRKKWFWITIVSIFIIVSATTYIANYSFYSDQADKATVSQSKSLATKKKIANDASFISKYNSIKTGKNGFSKSEIVDLLGEPNNTERLAVDKSIVTLSWNGTDNKQNVTVQITLEKNKATAKSIQGLDIDRKKLLSMEDFDKLKVGDSYNKVINALGDPDNYSDVNGMRTLIYQTDLTEADPSVNSLIKIELSNNKVINKEQQNLKQ